jgi:serine protease
VKIPQGSSNFSNSSLITFLHHPSVDSIVYPDRISSSSQDSVPRELAETTPYGIGHVKAEAVPDDDSATRKVCVVDDGYDMGHEDLPFDETNTQITGESLLVSILLRILIGSHGTHVTGTIAAIGGNDIGVEGVLRNGNVKLHIARVFPPSGGTSTSTVIAGYESCGQNGANVINMSLGGGGYTQSFADAISDAYTAGIVTFASPGNSYGTGYNYPASYPFVLSVGSITELGQVPE